MKIMNLSIEDYQQWLQSNPSISQVLAYGDRTINKMINAASRFIATIKAVSNRERPNPRRSCLAPMPCKPATFPLSYNRNAAEQDQTTYAFRSSHYLWAMYIESESAYTQILNKINSHIDIEMDLIDSLTYAKN